MKIFISYARSDASDIAIKLATALEDNNIDVWLDTSDIKAGGQWKRNLERAIQESTIVLAIRSPSASESFWVQNERLYAINEDKIIIPILAYDMPKDDMELIAYQHVDFRHNFDVAFQKLLTELPSSQHLYKKDDLIQTYLGKVLLEHEIWQSAYTPMSAQSYEEEQAIEVLEVEATRISTIFSLFDESLFSDMQPEATQTIEKKHDNILDVLAQSKQLIILGEPGSGKTTTLWRIFSDLAQKAIEDKLASIPVLVRLGNLENNYGLVDQFKTNLGELGAYFEELLNEKRISFLVDGLNELSQTDALWHQLIIQQLRKWAHDCQANNQIFIATCREIDYQKSLELKPLTKTIIQPLNPLQIREFLQNRIKNPPHKADELFWELAGHEQQLLWKKFSKRLEHSYERFWLGTELSTTYNWTYDERFDWDNWINTRDSAQTLLSLAKNPYMLFMFVEVYRLAQGLPQNRGLLLAGFVKILLEKREGLTPEDAQNLINGLSLLAYQTQLSNQGTVINHADVIACLSNEDNIYIAKSANLLDGQDTFRFTHQILQEYFAASELRKQLSSVQAEQYWSHNKMWQVNQWDETAIIMTGLSPKDSSSIVHWLGSVNPELTTRCILESGAHTPQETLTNLQTIWLSRFSSADVKSGKERASFGRALARLNLDNRQGVGLNKHSVPDIQWKHVPATQFSLHDGNFIEIAEFWMAQFPVTNWQFQAFLNAKDGYHNEAWWAHSHSPTSPAFSYGNHPRERVNWFEAMAFCNWLDYKCKQGLFETPVTISSEYTIRLPNEIEWEFAATGNNRQNYSFEGRFERDKLNVLETGINMTSAVGIFPEGVSPFGIEDMCGNVYEWCEAHPAMADITHTDEQVLKGGGWNSDRLSCQISFRLPNIQSVRDYAVGFRVVFAP